MYAHEIAVGRGAAVAARPAAARSRSYWDDVLDLQRSAGNRAVLAALAARPREATLPFRLAGAVAQRDIYDDIEAESAAAKAPAGDAPTGAGAAGTAPAVPPGAPGLLPDEEEASYRSRGESTLGDLGGPVTVTVTTGHTPAGPIAGFPGWFSDLQNRLIASTDWRKDKEEPAQQLLADYALKRFAVPYGNDASKVPPTIRVYAHYIGRSTSNQRAAAKEGLPNTAEVGGPEGAKLWCAAAGTASLRLGLESVGLTFGVHFASWTKSPPVPTIGLPSAPTDAPIEAGDQVSYIGGGAPVTGGHTTSVVSPSQGEGSVFLHASGNAGGGTSGSVRLTSSKPRAKPPASLTFADFATKVPASIGATSDKVWVYAIVKYSQIWLDLAKIDSKAPDAWTTGPGAEFVKKYNLKPLPLET
jgi:hypothetical protein